MHNRQGSMIGRWTRCSAALLFAVLAGCQFSPAPNTRCGADCRAEFVFPVADEEVTTTGAARGVDIAIGRGDMPAEMAEPAAARVEYSANGGENWQPAKVEILGHVSGLPADPVLLRARGIPDGDLLLRSSLTAVNGILYQAQPVPVKVWYMPKPKGKVTAADPMNDGRKIRVKFDGTGSTDGKNNAGGIRGWEWDFGDGTPKVTGSTPTHTYQRRGKFMVVLCVTDSKGYRRYKYYELDTGDDPRDTPPPTIFGEELPDWPSCQCTKMTIDHRQGRAFAAGYLNKWGKKGFTSDFGTPNVRSPRVMYGFEVIAEIKGNPDKCYEWQEIKRTSTLGTRTVHANKRRIGGDDGRRRLRANIKPRAKGEFPQSGSAYGLDGYDIPDRSKQHQPGIIRWRDTPGMAAGINGGTTTFATIGGGYDYHADFLATVGGPVRPPNRNGECTCSFNLHIGVSQAGTVTHNKLTSTSHPLKRQCVFTP